MQVLMQLLKTSIFVKKYVMINILNLEHVQIYK